MSFPAYQEYKKSGVAWIESIPKHWTSIRLKNILKQKITDGPHSTPIFTSEGVPFLSVDGIQNGELIFESCRYISPADHAEFKRKALPQKNDLLMGKAASTGKIARVKVDFEFSIWSPLALIRIDKNFSVPEFVEYALKSRMTQAEIDTFCTANTQKNISMDDIPRLSIFHPPLKEQKAIALFLDHQTTKIETLISEQEKLVGLLKEKRQSFISHAVTKGLNPEVKMKESGVDWLRNIPDHWKVSNGRKIFKIKKRIVGELGYDVLSITQKGIRIKDIESNEGQLSMDYSKYQLVEVGDFAMNHMDLLTGYVDLSVYVGVTSPDYRVFSIQNKDTCCPEYFLYLLQNGYSNKIFYPYGQGSSQLGRWRLPTEQFKEFCYPVPPIEEQKQIALSISKEAKNIDALIHESNKVINLLQERRSALISAAVTGQIDVRNYQLKEIA